MREERDLTGNILRFVAGIGVGLLLATVGAFLALARVVRGLRF